MTVKRSGRRRWSAVLAAYLLVIQAALTGLTLGAHAETPRFGLSGDVICSSAATLQDIAPARTKHRSPPVCCVLGCAMFGGGLGPAPVTAFVTPPRTTERAAGRGGAFDAVVATPERSPRTTRAPPLAV